MKNFAFFLIMLAFVAGCQKGGPKGSSENPGMEMANDARVRDGLFIHITHASDDPHRAVMPLKMAVMMSDSKDVLVYLDIRAIELVLREAGDVQFPTFPGSKESLKALLDKGVGVYACPSCLKALGKTEADLIEGVQLANKDAFFDFTQGRIISLDY